MNHDEIEQNAYNLTFHEDGRFEFSVNDPAVSGLFAIGAKSLRQNILVESEDNRERVEFGNDMFTIESFGDNDFLGLDRQHKNDGVIRGKLKEGVEANEATKEAIIDTFKKVADQEYNR